MGEGRLPSWPSPCRQVGEDLKGLKRHLPPPPPHTGGRCRPWGWRCGERKLRGEATLRCSEEGRPLGWPGRGHMWGLEETTSGTMGGGSQGGWQEAPGWRSGE